MKFAFALLALLAFAGGAMTATARPGNRYVFIGSFETSNPFNWDRDTIHSNVNDWSEAMIFEIDRGNDIEVRDVRVDCHGRPNCFRSRGGSVNKGRGVRVQFRRDLVVQSIEVQSKPQGWSIPNTRVNVYLELARGNDGGW